MVKNDYKDKNLEHKVLYLKWIQWIYPQICNPSLKCMQILTTNFSSSSNLDTYSTTPDLRRMQSPWASRVLAQKCLSLLAVKRYRRIGAAHQRSLPSKYSLVNHPYYSCFMRSQPKDHLALTRFIKKVACDQAVLVKCVGTRWSLGRDIIKQLYYGWFSKAKWFRRWFRRQ